MSLLPKKIIPMSQPYIGFLEYKYVLRSMVRNKIGAASENNKICEEEIAKVVKHKMCKLTSNGTVALQIAFDAAKYHLKKNKLTVIIPNITFAATVNAALLTGNNVILADVDIDTGLLCRKSVKEILNQIDVDCICLVSLNGRLVSSDDIQFYSKQGIILIEDQAEAFISYYEKRIREQFIFMSTLSFYANKIVTCGEGGAVCFSNNNIYEWITTYVNHGMAMPGSYYHQMPGSNYRMSSFNAGLLRGQLERLKKIINHRRWVWSDFSSTISEISNLYSYTEIPWLLEYKSDSAEEVLERKLKLNKIQYRPYFSPMSTQPAFKSLLRKNLGNSEKFVDQRYFLPLYFGMKKTELQRIVNTINS